MKKQSRSKNLWNVGHLNFLILTITLALTSKVIANDAPSALLGDNTVSLDKINAVSELADIQPTDRAFQSLKSLDRKSVV